ncbi:MAG: hypothetical protein AAF291_12805 [Pseudomonadota bacterium]
MRIKSTLIPVFISAIGLAACDVQQTEEGEMPDVDVSVEEGNLPEYDVDAPELKVGTTEMDVEVPEVDVSTDTETVDVPVVGVEPGDVDEEDGG